MVQRSLGFHKGILWRANQYKSKVQMARISDNSLWGIALCYFFNFPKQCFNSYLSKRNTSFKSNFLQGAVWVTFSGLCEQYSVGRERRSRTDLTEKIHTYVKGSQHFYFKDSGSKTERENSSVAGKWECSIRFIFDPIQTFLFENVLPSLWWPSKKSPER